MRISRLIPTLLVALTAAVLAAGCGSLLSVGTNVSCVIDNAGTPYCFGDNAAGQAGHAAGTTPVAAGPVVLPKGQRAADIAVGLGDPGGNASVCALISRSGVSGASLRCWGADDHGQLGRGSAGAAAAAPIPVELPGIAVSEVGVGAWSTCAIGEFASGGTAQSTSVYCWGDNTYGQLGRSAAGISGPMAVPGTSSFRAKAGDSTTPSLLAVGGFHACAGIATELRCWGHGTSGELGNGASVDSTAPVTVKLPRQIGTVNAITAGVAFTCALANDRTGSKTQRVWCWGANGSGQLGNGSTAASAVPVKAPLGEDAAPASSVSAGGSHACAIAEDSTVWCWGANDHGQLGNGSTTASSTSVQVSGLKATTISAGGDQTCASTTTGHLVCWGGNAHGQLGNVASGDQLVPSDLTGIAGLTSPKARTVQVKGTASVGRTLSVATMPWANAVTYSYQWEQRGADGQWASIEGASTRSRLKLSSALAGQLIRVTVTGTNVWTETGIASSASGTSRGVRIAG